MSAPSYTEVAYFLKTFGLKGQLKVSLIDNVDLDFNDVDVIFVKDKGQHIPYFIESHSDKRGEIILKLEDIDSPESAKKLCKQEIYIDAATTSKAADFHNNPNILKGYQAYKGNQLLGTLNRLETYPQQVMAFITTAENGEIMIPLNDEFIVEIDQDKGAIYFELPDGLIDL